MRFADFLIGLIMAPNCKDEHAAFAGAVCLSDIKMWDHGHGSLLLSNAEGHVRLAVDRAQDVELIQFASIFGLTFCYDHGHFFYQTPCANSFNNYRAKSS